MLRAREEALPIPSLVRTPRHPPLSQRIAQPLSESHPREQPPGFRHGKSEMLVPVNIRGLRLFFMLAFNAALSNTGPIR